MTERNYSLLAAAYDDEATAQEEFKALKSLDDLDIIAAAVLSRDSGGTVRVKEHGGNLVARGSAVGAVAGVVVGLFAPPLLLTGVVGLAAGASVGEIVKRHEEKEIGVDAEEWLPPGSSAVVAVVDDRYLDRVDKAFEKASKKIAQAVDKGDYEAVVKAVNKGQEKVVDAIAS